jgi:predicted Zn finger-like uncharacterized protein
MIITCNNCNKKFDLSSDLIPENGRLLVCGACNHQWFFKKDVINDIAKSVDTNNSLLQNEENLDFEKNENKPKLFNKPEISKIKNDKTDTLNLKEKNNDLENLNKNVLIKKNSEKKSSFLKITIVFIISFIALIILIDTFKYQISKILPNIDFILYNLYETIIDIILFFKDLI